MPRTKLATARERAKLSQRALADRVGVKRISIYRIEHGQVAPSVELALRISHELGESVEDLFGGGGR